MKNGGNVGNNDMEIWNAEAEKSIDVTPPTLRKSFKLCQINFYTPRFTIITFPSNDQSHTEF